MTPSPLPQSKHDLALWLVSVLTGHSKQGSSVVTGTLPVDFDFDAVDQALDTHGIAGVCDSSTRRIEFHPSWANVYASMDELLAVPGNLGLAPTVFTLLDSNCTYRAGDIEPVEVTQYLHACKLYKLMQSVADLQADGQNRMVFLQRHDAKLAISLRYDKAQLLTLNDLDEFASTFVDSTHHKDQKRTIIRTSLIDLFKSESAIDFGQLLQKFEDFMERVRNAYAMYVAEFTFEKIKAEVEKDNLDSTIKLQKTITDIQNQLLAFPVAVFLAGVQMSPEPALTIKNVVVWLGCIVFVGVTLVLISNQRYTISAIAREVKLRYSKTEKLPAETRTPFQQALTDLQSHIKRQGAILNWLFCFVCVSALLSTGLLFWYSKPTLREYFSESPVAVMNVDQQTKKSEQPLAPASGTKPIN